MGDEQRYYSYILRVWLAGDRDQPQWHASLEDTHTGERRGFASLAALNAYLNQQTGLQAEQEHGFKERRA
jgi:hypothetical protein